MRPRAHAVDLATTMDAPSTKSRSETSEIADALPNSMLLNMLAGGGLGVGLLAPDLCLSPASPSSSVEPEPKLLEDDTKPKAVLLAGKAFASSDAPRACSPFTTNKVVIESVDPVARHLVRSGAKYWKIPEPSYDGSTRVTAYTASEGTLVNVTPAKAWLLKSGVQPQAVGGLTKYVGQSVDLPIEKTKLDEAGVAFFQLVGYAVTPMQASVNDLMEVDAVQFTDRGQAVRALASDVTAKQCTQFRFSGNNELFCALTTDIDHRTGGFGPIGDLPFQLFPGGGPKPEDIKQTTLGDCYLQAVLIEPRPAIPITSSASSERTERTSPSRCTASRPRRPTRPST